MSTSSSSSRSESILHDYPWSIFPLVVSAPMRLISTPPLAIEVSHAGGLGFVAAGTEPESFAPLLKEAGEKANECFFPIRKGCSLETLPFGIGIINWGHSSSDAVVQALSESKFPPPAAIWLFAPREMSDLGPFCSALRKVTGGLSKIWIQVGSIEQVVESCQHGAPDVLVVQGQDAGGHGLSYSCGIISLVPETIDTLDKLYGAGGELSGLTRPRVVAAGGIADGRGAAAALALGAEGLVMGTRYLASPEANVKDGYKHELIRAGDGGQHTVRTKVYDTVRGTDGWPARYGGRGVINATYKDAINGMDDEQNKHLYQEALKMGDAGWGPDGRITTYAGASVGLINDIKPAKQITKEVQQQCSRIIAKMSLKNVP